MKVGAFLFDLDGTLIDTESAWAVAIVDLLAGCGEVATHDEILPAILGRNWFDIHKALHERYPKLGNTTAQEDAVRLRPYYNRCVTDPKELIIADSVEFLKRVSAIAPIAIVSGSPHDDIVAAAFHCGITDKINFILGAGEYPHGKPHPSGYLAAAAHFGVDPSTCVVLEDSVVGVASGVAAGMRVIALNRKSTPHSDFPGAWKIVESLSQVDVEGEFS